MLGTKRVIKPQSNLMTTSSWLQLRLITASIGLFFMVLLAAGSPVGAQLPAQGRPY